MKTIFITIIIAIYLVQQTLQTCFDNEYKDAHNQCQPCSESCKTCEESADKCTDCADENEILMANQCECQQGYVRDENNKCQQCDQCPQGFFSLENSFCPDVTVECTEKCDHRCQECHSKPTTCKVCSTGANRQDNPPVCSCEPGFHDNYGASYDCIACTENCISCEDSVSCDKCEDGYFLNKEGLCKQCYYYGGRACLQECPSHTTPNEETGRCETDVPLVRQEKFQMQLFLGIVLLFIIVMLYLCIYKYQHNKKQHQKLHNKQQSYMPKNSITEQNLNTDQQQESDNNSNHSPTLQSPIRTGENSNNQTDRECSSRKLIQLRDELGNPIHSVNSSSDDGVSPIKKASLRKRTSRSSKFDIFQKQSSVMSDLDIIKEEDSVVMPQPATERPDTCVLNITFDQKEKQQSKKDTDLEALHEQMDEFSRSLSTSKPTASYKTIDPLQSKETMSKSRTMNSMGNSKQQAKYDEDNNIKKTQNENYDSTDIDDHYQQQQQVGPKRIINNNFTIDHNNTRQIRRSYNNTNQNSVNSSKMENKSAVENSQHQPELSDSDGWQD